MLNGQDAAPLLLTSVDRLFCLDADYCAQIDWDAFGIYIPSF